MNRKYFVSTLVFAVALVAVVGVLFLFHRLVFLFSFDNLNTRVLAEVIENSLKLDVSTLSYLFIAAIAGSLCVGLIAKDNSGILAKIASVLVLLLVNLVAVADVLLYREWHSRITWAGLQHLANPKEVLQTVSGGTLAFFIIVVLVLTLAFYLLLRWLYRIHIRAAQPLENKRVALISTYIIVVPLLVIGCRGGLQPIPVNISDAYFSGNQVLNDAAVNPLWNVGYILLEARGRSRAENFITMSPAWAKLLAADYVTSQQDSAVSVFTTAHPNIIVIVVEGWSANAMGALGATNSQTPGFDQYSKEGILCTNAYAAAYLSDMGNAAIFSGFPGIRNVFINHESAKAAKIPSLFKSLKADGYSSAYFFGGQLSYGNIKSYLLLQGVDRVVEQQNFPENFPSGRLGIHDGYTLRYFLDEINKAKPPFVYSLFTGSTHSPYDFPGAGTSAIRSDYDYLASMHYADSVLGHFMAEAKKQAWYDSTLIVIVSDHSHGIPGNSWPHLPAFHRIPVLLAGGAIEPRFRGLKMKRLISQVDIVPTLLNQMGKPVNEYPWSVDFLKRYGRKWVFLPYHNGGIILEGDSFVSLNSKSDKPGESNVVNEAARQVLFLKAKAFQQRVYEVYEQW
jgi:phosphoglycerol transferase MdoB-like AlkP superfamily enzyme